MFFRAQSLKLDGESEIKISEIKDVPLPENSPEAKKRKREQEEHEMKEFLNELSATVSSDENNNSSEDNIFDPNAFVETDCDSDTEIICDCKCQCCGKGKSKVNRRNTKDLTLVIAAAINCGASNYQVAVLLTAILIVYGIITPDDNTDVVTERKIRDGRDRYMRRVTSERDAEVSKPGAVPMVSFDAAGTKPNDEKKINGRNHVIKGSLVDSYVVVNEPGGHYLTQFIVEENASPGRPYALITAETLQRSVENLGVSWSDVKVVGTDNENTNTGVNAGVLTLLEVLIGHKLERANCTLHLNELHYRAVCQKLGVKTLSGDRWAGPIGQSLPKVKDMKINEHFEPIPGETELLELPADVVDDLSSDQKTLYKMIKMVKTGEMIPNLQDYQVGTLGAARWLTHACAILRLYVSHHLLDPEETRKLRVIVVVIVDSYGPMWFLMKTRPGLVTAPRHWFTLLQISNRMDPEIRDVIQKNITRNSFYLFSESILLCYVTSDVRSERQYAVQMIKLIRAKQEDTEYGDKRPRKRPNPKKLNFQASKLDEVITEAEYLYESLLTCDIPTSKLDDLIEAPLVLPPFPSNTQSVERHIRGMQLAGKEVSSIQKRDGVMVTREIVSQHYSSLKRSKKDLHQLQNLSTATYADSLKPKVEKSQST